MRRDCPRGSTGTSRAALRLPLESAPLRAGPSYGLPGQALPPVTPKHHNQSAGQFFVSSPGQFRMSFDRAASRRSPTMEIRYFLEFRVDGVPPPLSASKTEQFVFATVHQVWETRRAVATPRCPGEALCARCGPMGNRHARNRLRWTSASSWIGCQQHVWCEARKRPHRHSASRMR